jgi:hypothetical protein
MTALDKNTKLNSEIELIKKVIVPKMNGSLISIILYGSYGRGEGAFYLDDIGNMRTYNDFDIILVLNSLVSSKSIHEISKELNDKLDVKWIDISQKTPKTLRNLKISVFNFDLKYGSRVIYGDQNILDKTPHFKAMNINLREAQTLYFTRLWTFLGSLPIDGFDRKLNSDEVRFFNYQMSKAILAVVDVILIRKGDYCSSYQKRVDKVRKISIISNDFKPLIEWAIKQKLSPSNEELSNVEVKERYEEILNVFLSEMYSALSIYHKKSIKDSFNLKKAVLGSKSLWLDFFKSVIKTRKFDYMKKIKLDVIQSFLAEAFLKEGKNQEELFKEAKKLLKQIEPSRKIDNLDWHELRIIISSLKEG